ncbi:hypothetical protein DMC30DRAFT_35515 [Rhodotorula diobovata]|uniref:Uncharacterized protein n=1 Tax=Rhodotorula diobovata TaxID=5288 RepID=A0A5C5FSQ5_9BASI|nr:hypothetical protein DMC30DRAFT_35515 [Rhodotorula diobovata]
MSTPCSAVLAALGTAATRQRGYKDTEDALTRCARATRCTPRPRRRGEGRAWLTSRRPRRALPLPPPLSPSFPSLVSHFNSLGLLPKCALSAVPAASRARHLTAPPPVCARASSSLSLHAVCLLAGSTVSTMAITKTTKPGPHHLRFPSESPS